MSTDAIARRELLASMAAATALAATGCTRAPREKILPYGSDPPELTPGVPAWYATAFTLEGYATGVLVESHDGRPTKVEGNPDHPASLGASSAFDQARVLSLYDPSRAAGVRRGGRGGGGAATLADVTAALAGDRLHLVLEPTTSPTTAALLADVKKKRPDAVVHFASALPRANAWQGARLAFGRVLEARVAYEDADVVVALDADFLASGPTALRDARAFASRRRPATPDEGMSRLYVVEPALTPTGSVADHRVRARRSDIAVVAAMLLAALGEASAARLRDAAPRHARFVQAVAKDLRAHAGRSAVVVGDAQPPIVHAMAHALNALLGNLGRTVTLAPSPVLEAGEASHDPEGLVGALAGGAVGTLAVLGPNLAYALPAAALGRAARSVYLGAHDDETAALCDLRVAQAHVLESWGDARAFDGTLGVQQPLVARMKDGRTVDELLSMIAGDAPRDAHDLVRDRWRADGRDDLALREALRRGLVAGTATATIDAPLAWEPLRAAIAAWSPPAIGGGDLELAFAPDARVYDGRFANDAWLLELPEPVTHLTWDNAARFSRDTARAHGVSTGDVVDLACGGRTVRAAAIVAPGDADGSITLSLGWGRSGDLHLAAGRGANAALVRRHDAPWSCAPVTVTRTPYRAELAVTQRHEGLEGRADAIVLSTTLDGWRARRDIGAEKRRTPRMLYQLRPKAQHQWGMAIDLDACTGCSACVVACQAENNVPTVGKTGVLKGRAMHWLRIDAYVEDEAAGKVVHQPMLCQHCEKAPCEYVCPVGATTHSSDGLNEMTYNRCVGTRFCANNCPYSVRRFNWYEYHAKETPLEALAHNPDVTVRQRGVMEKCTFCVQRIREGENHARAAGVPFEPKTVRTACEQACPTQAIRFGDVGDRSSEVARLSEGERAYAVLHELGTLPRVRYLTRVRNENPDLAGEDE